MNETIPVNNIIEKHEPLILAIETATRAGSVAVTKGQHVLSSQMGEAAVSHSANLIEMIEQVLQEAGTTLSDVDLLAAAVGPGSFTGLRIGLATVKALAVCSNRRVAGVSTLAAIAHASGAKGQIISLLPAGRGEVFAQLFSAEKGSVISLDAAAHLSPRALMDKYGGMSALSWAGEGALQQAAMLTAWARDKQSAWKIIQETGNLAEALAALALKDYEEGKSSSAEELHATYVRASDAEINERWQQEKAHS